MKKQVLILSIVAFFLAANSVSAQQNLRIYKAGEVDIKPLYPGGDKAYRTFIRKEVKFPVEARALNQKGVVYIKYLVKDDGSVDRVEFSRFMGLVPDENGKYIESKKEIEPIQSFVNEAIRVIKKFPKHAPGKKDGKAVAVEMETKLKFFAAGK